MFIGKYDLDGETYNDIYFTDNDGEQGYLLWFKDTLCADNTMALEFKVKGNSYEEKKENARQLAIDWQLNFSGLSWSYYQLSIIEDYLLKIGKRYGLLKEFKENAVC